MEGRGRAVLPCPTHSLTKCQTSKQDSRRHRLRERPVCEARLMEKNGFGMEPPAA